MDDVEKKSDTRKLVSTEIEKYFNVSSSRNQVTEEFSKGDLRVNSQGILEQYSEGYWQEVENRR